MITPKAYRVSQGGRKKLIPVQYRNQLLALILFFMMSLTRGPAILMVQSGYLPFRELAIMKFIVEAFHCQEFLMCTLLHNGAIIHYQNQISIPDG